MITTIKTELFCYQKETFIFLLSKKEKAFRSWQTVLQKKKEKNQKIRWLLLSNGIGEFPTSNNSPRPLKHEEGKIDIVWQVRINFSHIRGDFSHFQVTSVGSQQRKQSITAAEHERGE